MQAIVHDTAPAANSPWVMPGRYTVKLTAGGQSYTQVLTVKMDPRVRTPAAGLMEQFTLSKQCYDSAVQAEKIAQEVRSWRDKLKTAREQAGQGATAESIAAFDKRVAEIAGAAAAGRRFGGGRGGARGPETIASVAVELGSLMRDIENADVAPSSALAAAVRDRRAAMSRLVVRWNALKAQELPKLNAQLKAATLPEIVE